MNDEGDMSFHWLFKVNWLKKALRIWNKTQFGNIFESVKKAKEDLSKAQYILDESFSEDHLQQVAQTQ